MLFRSEHFFDDESMWGKAVYQILECQGCKGVSFREVDSNSEDIEQVGPEEYRHTEFVRNFPQVDINFSQLDHQELLPNSVLEIYEETWASIISGQKIISAIGIRSLVEAVCKEKSAEGGNLKQKITDLKTKGLLTESGHDILHSLRIMGNRSAHEIEPSTKKELQVAMEAVEHLLNSVFILPERTSGLPKE